MQSSIDPSVLDICTLRPLLSCEVSSTFPAGSIVDEQLECPDLQERMRAIIARMRANLQERMRAIGAALVLRQLLNQRGCGLSAISENSQDIGLGLSPGQMAALRELEVRAVEVVVRPGPMAKKRPLTPDDDTGRYTLACPCGNCKTIWNEWGWVCPLENGRAGLGTQR